MLSSEALRGREILLAGGSGGIGEAVTSALLAEGARIILSYRRNRERAIAWQNVATVLQADLASPADRTRLLEAAPELYGLVVLSGDPARGHDGMAVSHESNFLGPVLLAREASERMKRSGMPGAIVLVSTMQANALFPGSTVYAAQKAALQHAARILAKECRGPTNIRVNVVSPGVIDAGMARESLAAGKYDYLVSQRIVGRFGRPTDVARAIRFLLEPDNYVTGQVIGVDGGVSL